ncbi:MAG: hypothetical protein HN607_07460 [Verrucomicrobia bacterium]|nr:hypothetical protein [Verrucomicrobiota bacterium]
MFIVFGHKEVVELLIAVGAGVKVKDKPGRTTLDLAMDNLTFDEATIPEPFSAALLGVEGIAVLLYRRRN